MNKPTKKLHEPVKDIDEAKEALREANRACERLNYEYRVALYATIETSGIDPYHLIQTLPTSTLEKLAAHAQRVKDEV
jgi:hypothetical protein